MRPRQKEIVDILVKQTLPLTGEELRKLMGDSREHGPRRHLEALQAMGYLAPRKKHEHRAIMLSEAGRAALARKAA